MVKKQKPRITVLMAIYNCASTLPESLDSLLSQTYQDFKIILCDDCSKDATLSVAEQYAKRYPDKIILIRNAENLKLPASLNRCLEYADTEYVARMDGDDISKPDRFAKELEFLDEHPEYAVVSCAMEHFDETGVFKIFRQKTLPDKSCFIGSTPHCHAPCMIRTSALRAVGGYTVKRWTQQGQDVHLWAKMYSNGFRGYNLSDILYSMRDDNAAYKRRTVKEAFVAVRRNYEIFKLMHISRFNVYGLIRPVLVALLPEFLYNILHRR